MENKNFIKVQTAKKTQEQIDRENAERDKKLRAEKLKKNLIPVLILIGLVAAFVVWKVMS